MKNCFEPQMQMNDDSRRWGGAFFLMVVHGRVSAVIFFLLFALLARAEFTNGTPRIHEFVYPTNDITPQTVVFIYTNSNPALALTNSLGQTLWPLWRAVTNLDTVTGTNNTPVLLSLPQLNFVARASNEWGLGDFSIVLRSKPPREDVSQRVR